MFICRICGFKSFEVTQEVCRCSPTKKHQFIEEIPEGYFCQYCGYTSHTCECGDCQNSPIKKHSYIGKKTGEYEGHYTCKYCGWAPTYVMGGPCKMSRTGSTSSSKPFGPDGARETPAPPVRPPFRFLPFRRSGRRTLLVLSTSGCVPRCPPCGKNGIHLYSREVRSCQAVPCQPAFRPSGGRR